MDDIVRAALAKWPNVPHCYNWLALDARGDWYMRDDRCQAAGPFPHPKGSRILHDKLREFIARNYEADEHGCWFFQNGPQRVYVELEAAPWVWRLQRGDDGALRVQSHTGLAASLSACWLDEAGRLYLATDIGLGLVHSLDMDLAAEEVEAGRWQPQDSSAEALAAQFGYVRSPAAAQPAHAA
ncbi:DUF2946 family protein [Ideonella azotifigens]|uniref:DUF2946 family protein n=1 Tax=Ideonella azotifigens TaxID=513160 RepID=A0ABN1KB05_9BURK|nr:DUF2946 family protein [Ideonella azotifigens]MCD2338754.1 DUF2946 family protein [Ideonella azotifigens]